MLIIIVVVAFESRRTRYNHKLQRTLSSRSNLFNLNGILETAEIRSGRKKVSLNAIGAGERECGTD